MPTIQKNAPPLIPNEYLLNYFNRNDLRWAISSLGGRENVAHLLGGSKIIPGKWKEAKEVEEVAYLIPKMKELDKEGIKSKRRDVKTGKENEPIQNKRQMVGMQQSQDIKGGGNVVENASTNESNRGDSTTKEFWSKEKAIKELQVLFVDVASSAII